MSSLALANSQRLHFLPPEPTPPSLSLILLLKQIMAYSPSIPTLIRKQLCTSHVKYLPAIKPHRRLLLPIRLLQPRPNLLLTPIHLIQPILARSRIVRTTDPPLRAQRQVILEEMQQVRARHRPAREEMLAHPACFEVVRGVSVRKDMHEQLTLGLQCMSDLAHQQGVVLHVLEQLDADDPVVLPHRELVGDDIAREDGQILQPFPLRLALDVDPLRPRIRKRGDLGPREPLRKIQTRTAPTTPKIEHLLAVTQPRFVDIRLQHRDLRLRECLAARRVQACRVLHAGAQVGLENGGPHLVVLRIGFGGFDGDGPGAQVRHV